MKQGTAYLSNIKDCICFSYNGRNIRFRGPYSLKKIERVKNWDHGYIVIDAIYTHSKDPVEDYIDMFPILEQLYIEPESFISTINHVEVANA